MKLRTQRHQQSTFPRNSPETHLYPTPCRRSSESEDKVDRLVKSMYGTQDASHIWQLDYVSLICEELGGFRRGRHSAAFFHVLNEDVRMEVHGDDFVCLSDDDGLKHIDNLLKSNCTAKDMGTLGFGHLGVKSFLLMNCEFSVGTDQTGQHLDIELDLRHAPLIISEIRMQCEHRNTEYTTRETTRKTGVRRKTESDSEERRCDKVQTRVYETFIFLPKTD